VTPNKSVFYGGIDNGVEVINGISNFLGQVGVEGLGVLAIVG